MKLDRLSVSPLALLICLTSPALASTDPQTEPTPEPHTVTVTAKKTEKGQNRVAENGALGEKKLLDTPFSISVVDEAELSKRQTSSLAQVFANDTSVWSTAPSATTDWWGSQIRGMPVRNYYVDGTPLLLYWGGEFPLEPIEKVEALKGLSGFMYGFGAPGGVISYTLKKPTETRLLATEVGYRNDGALSARVDAGGRIGSTKLLGYRANLAVEDGDAYNGAGINRALASLALDYRLTPDVTWHVSLIGLDSKLEHEPIHFYWDDLADAKLPSPSDNYNNVLVKNSFYKTKTLVGSTGLKWQINEAWRASVVAGYTRKSHYSNKMFAYMLNADGDYRGMNYNFSGRLVNRFAQATLEGRLQTARIRHEIVVGAALQETKDRWGTNSLWRNDFNGNIHRKQTFVAAAKPSLTRFDPVSAIERQTSVFASDTMHFGEQWQAVIGLRHTYYDQEDMDGKPEVASGYNTKALTPTVAVIYKPLQTVSIYSSYVESMEGGTRVGDTYANAGQILKATVSKQAEVGVKVGHERLTFTSAAFRVERVAQLDQYRGGLKYLTQDGLTLYRGVEASGSYALTDNLKVGAGATYLDATIKEVSPANASLRGKRPSGTSKWNLAANAEYTLPKLPSLSLHGNVRYVGDAYYEDANRLRIPARAITSVGFQYRTEMYGQGVTFTGNVNNLFNKLYWDHAGFGEGINAALSAKVNW